MRAPQAFTSARLTLILRGSLGCGLANEQGSAEVLGVIIPLHYAFPKRSLPVSPLDRLPRLLSCRSWNEFHSVSLLVSA